MGKPKNNQRQISKLLKRSSKHLKLFQDNNTCESSLTDNLSKPAYENNKIRPGLYIVATPIGNARDITLRALDILQSADVVVCEDTRVTSKLLAIYNITRPLISYHEHNSTFAGPKIIKRLKLGEIVALVSDAGTPLISDPGFRLVQSCAKEKIYATHIPGASSILTSLVLAGLPTDKFFFAGYPPNKAGKRSNFFEHFKFIPATLIFLESPKRLARSLVDMARVFGPREAALARELTKKFEEIRKGSLIDLSNYYLETSVPKGEITILVSPPLANETEPTREEMEHLLNKALDSSTLKDAVSEVTLATGAPKRVVYTHAIKLISQKKE